MSGQYSLGFSNGYAADNTAQPVWQQNYLSQTGAIPSNAQSLRFLATGSFAVLVGGKEIPVQSLGCNAYAGDIAGFSGMTTDIRFVNTSTNSRLPVILDDIVFSPWAFPHGVINGDNNDNFANATWINGSAGTVNGSNTRFSRETGEHPVIFLGIEASNEVGRSAWWTWTAPASGTVTFNTEGSGFDTVLAVYTGNSIGSRVFIALDDDGGAGLSSLTTFNAVAGTTYRIAVDGFAGESGSIVLNWSSAIVPPPVGNNDAFTNAVVLTGATGTSSGSNNSYTREAGEPNHANGDGVRSAWWTWTAPASGSVTFNTEGSGFDTVLAVYTGNSMGALVNITSDDDSGVGATSLVEFTAVAGTTYRIAVDGFAGESGSIVLNWRSAIEPPPVGNNDAFANAVVITGLTGTSSGSNTRYTLEAGETRTGSGGESSAWWTWTAPASGRIMFNTDGSDFDAVLSVYTGNLVRALVDIDTVSSGLSDWVLFDAVLGTTYQIAVDGFEGESGAIVLNWKSVGVPPPVCVINDALTSAVVIRGGTGTRSGSNIGCTRETGEPNHANGDGVRSAWWTWTAPASGSVTFKTEGSSFDTVLAVYTGNSMGALVLIASDDDSGAGGTSLVRFTATAGTAYQIAVDGWNGSSGSIALNWGQGGVVNNDNFANASAINGATGSVNGSNTRFSRETGEPTHQIAGTPAANVGQRSAWWNWTAPASGSVTFTTAGSTFDTVLGVYTGTAVESLTTVSLSDEVSEQVLTSSVTFNAVAGTTYRIAVDGFRLSSGTQPEGAIVLNWSPAIVPPPVGDVVADALAQWHENGPVERLTVVQKNADAFDGLSRTSLTLRSHPWTNRVAHTHGLVLEASGAAVDYWRVTSTNRSLALAVERRTPLESSTDGLGVSSSRGQVILYAERFLPDGTRQTLGPADWDRPRFFVFHFQFEGSPTGLTGWLEVSRTNGEWSARNGSSTSVVGGPSIVNSDRPTEVLNLDLDRDGFVDFISVGHYEGTQIVISSGFYEWIRELIPVGESAIMMDPLRSPRERAVEVHSGRTWSSNVRRLATWTRTVNRFGGSSTVTGPFSQGGDMGVRIVSTNGTRYGWIHWSTNRIVNLSNDLRGLAWVPSESVVGWGSQSLMTGQGIGNSSFRMERIADGRIRLRWLPSAGQSLERWIPGNSQGWQPFEPNAADSHLFDALDSHALFRIRTRAN